MSIYAVDGPDLKNIADAIRFKTENDIPLKITDMPQAIKSIVSPRQGIPAKFEWISVYEDNKKNTNMPISLNLEDYDFVRFTYYVYFSSSKKEMSNYELLIPTLFIKELQEKDNDKVITLTFPGSDYYIKVSLEDSHNFKLIYSSSGNHYISKIEFGNVTNKNYTCQPFVSLFNNSYTTKNQVFEEKMSDYDYFFVTTMSSTLYPHTIGIEENPLKNGCMYIPFIRMPKIGQVSLAQLDEHLLTLNVIENLTTQLTSFYGIKFE